MAAFLDVLIHYYYIIYIGVKYWFVWGVVTNDIPPLIAQLEQLMRYNGKEHLLLT